MRGFPLDVQGVRDRRVGVAAFRERDRREWGEWLESESDSERNIRFSDLTNT